MLNSLLGLRSDFGRAVRSLVAAQAGLAIVLASLAPFTLVWYASSARYSEALLFNGAMFAVASFVRAMARAPILPTADRQQPPASLGVVGLAVRLHARGHPNGLAAAAVRRFADEDVRSCGPILGTMRTSSSRDSFGERYFPEL